MLPVILAIQLQQVERIQEHRLVMSTGMKSVSGPEATEGFDHPRDLETQAEPLGAFWDEWAGEPWGDSPEKRT
jgi:hypothetical protein